MSTKRLYFLKFIFACATYWTGPVIRYILKGGTRLYTIGGITNFRIIFITTYEAFIFFHQYTFLQ